MNDISEIEIIEALQIASNNLLEIKVYYDLTWLWEKKQFNILNSNTKLSNAQTNFLIDSKLLELISSINKNDFTIQIYRLSNKGIQLKKKLLDIFSDTYIMIS